jgi:hypothetical protein
MLRRAVSRPAVASLPLRRATLPHAARRPLASAAPAPPGQGEHSHSRQSRSDDPPREGGLKTLLNSSGFETAMGACVGVLLLGGAAMGYQAWYKSHVLSKMEKAFEGGYDPVLALARGGDQLAHAEVLPLRDEEALVRRIVEGKEPGRYFLILGSKVSRERSHLLPDRAAGGVSSRLTVHCRALARRRR